MKKKAAAKRLSLSQASVDAFAKKLIEWSSTLSNDERKLVRMLVDRATAINLGDLGGYDLSVEIKPTAEKVLKSLQEAAKRLPSGGATNLEPGDITWMRTMITTPDWKNASSVVVNPPGAVTRGGGQRG